MGRMGSTKRSMADGWSGFRDTTFEFTWERVGRTPKHCGLANLPHQPGERERALGGVSADGAGGRRLAPLAAVLLDRACLVHGGVDSLAHAGVGGPARADAQRGARRP